MSEKQEAGKLPSERGRNYTPPAGGALRPAGGFLRKADDFCSALIITGDVTLPLRWLPPATPLWACQPKSPCVTSYFRVTEFSAIRLCLFNGIVYNEASEKSFS